MIIGLLTLAMAGPDLRLDRVDLVSETSGTWLHDELPRAGSTPRFVGARWVEQVQPVIAIGPTVQVGLALRTQSVRLEHTVTGPWSVNGGLQLGAGLPNGAIGGVGYRAGALRLGTALSVVSSATWARPTWTHWRLLPTVGIGVGPVAQPTAPWM